MIPFFDDSGPTLYVNTISSSTMECLMPMLEVLHKRTNSAYTAEKSDLPRLSAAEMNAKGIVSGM